MSFLTKPIKHMYKGIDFILEKIFITMAIAVLVIVKSVELFVNIIRFGIIARILRQFKRHGVFQEMEYIPK